nr:hypothetical protein [Tanacetum cinerariifolium]
MKYGRGKTRMNVQDDDRLSNLPDDLIHKILSFVGIKLLVQTSTLSSRWSFRGNACQVFVTKILNYVVSHNVKQLTVSWFPYDCKVEFPLSLFSSRSLKHLNINGLYVSHVTLTSTWEVTSLTTLHLEYITFNDKVIGYLQIFASIEQYSDLSEMTIEEAIGRVKTHEERIKYKKGKQVDNQEKLMFTRHKNKEKYFRGRRRGKHKSAQGKNHERFKEERKDGETSHKNSNRNNFKKSSYDTSKLQCFKCKKIGHIAPNCPQRTKTNEQSNLVEEDLEPTLLMEILEDSDEEKQVKEVEEQKISLHEEDVGYKEANMDSLWYLDNRASNHMTGVREHFKELDEKVSGKVVIEDEELRLYDMENKIFMKVTQQRNPLYKANMRIGMDTVPPRLADVLVYLILISEGSIVESVISRIVLAASTYFIWQEINGRLFTNKSWSSVLLSSKILFDIDSKTRKHLTVHVHFAPDPKRISLRFPDLESLTLKSYSHGHYTPEECSIPVTPRILEIAKLESLKSLSIRKLVVSAFDLQLLAATRGGSLRSLLIRGCKMFSDDGLEDIARCCIDLRIMESLHFEYPFDCYDMEDVTLLAKKCSKSLLSLNIFPKPLRKFRQVFKHAKKLDHSGYRGFDEDEDYSGFEFPSNIRGLHIEDLTEVSFPFLRPYLNQLRDLHLKCVGIEPNCQCYFFNRCPGLEVLRTKDICGDEGLKVISHFCKKLRKLTHHGWVTQKGLIAVAQGCPNLEYLEVYILDISNIALECVGTSLKNLRDFRIYLDEEGGLLELLKGCPKLRKLKLSGCPFSKQAIATFVFSINPSLRYVWLDYVSPDVSVLIRPMVSVQALTELIRNEERDKLGGTSEKPFEIIVRIANVELRFTGAYPSFEFGDIKLQGRVKDGVPHLTKVGAFEVDVSFDGHILLC